MNPTRRHIIQIASAGAAGICGIPVWADGIVSEIQKGDQLMAAIEAEPTLELTIDVERRTLEAPAIGLSVEFPLEESIQHRLLNGLDDIGITLGHDEDISAFESHRPAWMPTTS